ncbi:hypothetical protein J437_LFUL017451 [Ladona fulva]|uniref:Splicing factor 3A subunit 1 n=1 Tax=Ladona fulva TaxID=123851 RepID=A0A8K0P9A8_LADFU|nr:hypothetical protein J437_LFUL017451 [Ladona fulva]
MPSVDVSVPPPENQESSAPSSQPVVGIIYPPPEVRNIVDKTASFVARNGPEFEARIRQNELGNPKFNFLNAGDPYHAYYQHKVKEYKEGKGQEPSLSGSLPTIPPQKTVTAAAQLKQQEILKQVEQPFVPKDPPAEFEFVADPPSISALDLDIVKLTAQFVARNGRQFLTNLMNREQRNYQFDFLRPQHSLFQYFTKLLEQYTKVLIPPKDLMSKLMEETSNMNVVLEQVKYRAEWIKHQEAQKRREEEEAEKERVAYAQIDWHNFVVVEKVDYQPFEHGNFPPPTTPDEVGARVLMQVSLLPVFSATKVQRTPGPDEYLISPITGEKIPASKVQEHMRIGLLDPRWVEQRDRQIQDKLNQETVFAQERRTDIFGIGDEETAIGKKIGEEDKRKDEKERIEDWDEIEMQIESEEEEGGEEEDQLAKEAKDNTQVQDMEEESSEEEDEEGEKGRDAQPLPPPPPPPPKEVPQPPPLPPMPDRVVVKKGYDPKQQQGLKFPHKLGAYAMTLLVTWDGHTSSVEAATRAARANITLEEQIHQIHKVKGLLPDEEKEKIGPKPNTRAGTGMQYMMQQQAGKHHHIAPLMPPAGTAASIQTPKPQAKVAPPKPMLSSAPPTQPPVPPTQTQPPAPAPPPLRMAPMPPPAGAMVPPQPGLMMEMRNNSYLSSSVQGRPGFPVPPQGFMPPPPVTAPTPPAPPQPGTMKLPDSEEEPPTKKMRTEETLMPEGEFMAKNPSPVTLKVAVPNMSEKPEWRLKGQLLTLTLPLTDTVSVIKAKVHEETGMPPGKQKLHLEGMFFKDSNSLAYYNILPGTVVNLQLKERGGRKK